MQRSSFKKKVAMGAVAAAVGIVATLGVAAPASAANGNCPSSYLCTWKDSLSVTDGSGSALQLFQQYITNYNKYKYLGTNHNAGNSATSIYNNGITETAYMYANTGRTTILFSIPKGSWNYFLSGSHGDNIESGYYASFNG
jgi:hypothetical protein